MRPLDVVLCWHMHQPSYRTADGEFQQPWVYLHAAKDYADMAWHLERVGDARAVVNFTPVLLDQIGDYAEQFERDVFDDALLRALQRGDADTPELRPALSHALCPRGGDCGLDGAPLRAVRASLPVGTSGGRWRTTADRPRPHRCADMVSSGVAW